MKWVDKSIEITPPLKENLSYLKDKGIRSAKRLAIGDVVCALVLQDNTYGLYHVIPNTDRGNSWSEEEVTIWEEPNWKDIESYVLWETIHNTDIKEATRRG